MKNVLLMAVLEFVRSVVVTINLRALSKGRIWLTVSTDAVIAVLGFVILVLMIEAHSMWQMLGYVIGTCAGSLLGMWQTKDWKDESHAG